MYFAGGGSFRPAHPGGRNAKTVKTNAMVRQLVQLLPKAAQSAVGSVIPVRSLPANSRVRKTPPLSAQTPHRWLAL